MHSMFTQDILDELNLLAKYNLESLQTGIKVHASAGHETVEAAERLFEKGLTTQLDGGYLTDRGVEMAQKVQVVLKAITAVGVE